MHKFTVEEKTRAVIKHIKDGVSFNTIADSLGISATTVRSWCSQYEAVGQTAFLKKRNNHYSVDFKLKCVQSYINGEGSFMTICRTNHIPDTKTLRSWVLLYNGYELKASPGGGRIMTKGRKTTIEERLSIVEACIKGEMNYEKTAEQFKVSYQQVYQWVHKYQEKGVKGLEDRRGKSKLASEMTEVEKLRAENKLLQAQLERKELENTFLKKLREIERRQL